MCQKAFDIQGYICDDKSKDKFGLLQSRGIEKGDYLLHGINGNLSGYSEQVDISHLNYKVVREDEDELLYLKGKEDYYNNQMPFLGRAYTITKELNFPVWRDVEITDRDLFEHLYYNLTAHNFIWWIPRQDQIQELFWNGLTEQAKARHFVEWLDTASYNPSTYSLEMLWMICYMESVHDKKWWGFGDWVKWNWIEKEKAKF